jgi:hypothetical protein
MQEAVMLRLLLLIPCLVCLLSSCVEASSLQPQTAAKTGSAPTAKHDAQLIDETIINNLTYYLSTDMETMGFAALKDGRHLSNPKDEYDGVCSYVRAFMVDVKKNDGTQDAIVGIIYNDGCMSIATYYYLYIVRAGANTFDVFGPIDLGYRTNAKFISSKDGVFTVKCFLRKEEDPPCCPSLEVNANLALNGDRIVDMSNVLEKEGASFRNNKRATYTRSEILARIQKRK